MVYDSLSPKCPLLISPSSYLCVILQSKGKMYRVLWVWACLWSLFPIKYVKSDILLVLSLILRRTNSFCFPDLEILALTEAKYHVWTLTTMRLPCCKEAPGSYMEGFYREKVLTAGGSCERMSHVGGSRILAISTISSCSSHPSRGSKYHGVKTNCPWIIGLQNWDF